MTKAIDHYAVLGNPISHSLSPIIQQQFAKQTGQAIAYERILVAPGQLAQSLDRFQQQGGKGVNITVPYKQEALAYVDSLTPRAQRAGAINTIVFQPDGKRRGDNTDGVGLIRDMVNNLHWQLAGRHILLIGAGGASRGILEPLLAQQPNSLHIVNRNVNKAIQLRNRFADLLTISTSDFAHLPEQAYDIIINATSASLSGIVPPLSTTIISLDSCCYDLVYSQQPTVFLKWAQQAGTQHFADGLGMLVEQAAEAFYLWRQQVPQTQVVIDYLRGL